VLYGDMQPGLDVVKPKLTSASLRLRGHEGDSSARSDSDSGRDPKPCGDYCFRLYGDEGYMVNHLHLFYSLSVSVSVSIS
jgi:hypothetical protein